jgi:hypothetical protein
MRLLLLFLAIYVTSVSSSCECSSYSLSSSRRLSSKVEFSTADSDNIGINYNRPKRHERIDVKKYLEERRVGGTSDDSECVTDQVHLTLGDIADSVIISFASTSINSESIVKYSTNKNAFESDGNYNEVTGDSTSYSELMYIVGNLYNPSMGVPENNLTDIIKVENTSTWAYDHQTGEHYANYYNINPSNFKTGFMSYNNPYAYYDSPILHTVTLTNLDIGVKYYYVVDGNCNIFSFTIPKNKYPMQIGLTVDLGQTSVSAASIAALEAINPDLVLLPGDLSYSDGYPYLWDSFGTLIQSLASQVPILTTAGNHEFGLGENTLSHRIRYPTPYTGSSSTNFCYYGKVVGAVNVISLCSYGGWDSNSLQYQWLTNYLTTSIDRDETPFVIAIMHAPWYNSNNGHWMEAELMRRSIEPLLYQYGVDIVLSGHIHCYERSAPVYNNTVDSCGPTYLNIGDGGNYEGTYVDWRTQPDWSEFRESSFGIGELTIYNATHAYFQWHRVACESASSGAPNYNMNFSTTCHSPGDISAYPMATSDHVWITKPSSKVCANRYMTSPSPNSNSNSNGNSNSYNPSSAEVSLIVLTVIFGVVIIILSILLYRAYKLLNGFNGAERTLQEAESPFTKRGIGKV